ncbi:hypothetical protein KY389_09340 [Paracoccus bogoriensis]|uniref:hypothetical protein n=1 Tax=Paracoccus bogoriensis TaxID=242065 RepID=UPI001CA51ED0|nr:hypothetical protein [Paracoccus bogoriensis]MBW7056897.1 hypothetical protein [Paracoccus bogoriensis]
MQLRVEHELHGRRRSRNVGLGIVLIAFVALVFALTVVKVRQGHMLEAFDHQPRLSLLPAEEPAEPAPNPSQEAAE